MTIERMAQAWRDAAAFEQQVHRDVALGYGSGVHPTGPVAKERQRIACNLVVAYEWRAAVTELVA